MSENKPLVSVLTPVYNGSSYIAQLIESVREQDYPRIEHIVIDDGSRDEGATVAVLEQYPHLKWWTRPNKGQAGTMNELVDAAQGEYILIIAADDYLGSTTCVSEAIAHFATSPSLDGVYGITQFVSEDGVPLRVQPLCHCPTWVYRYYSYLFHCSLFVKKSSLLAKSIRFKEDLVYTSDGDWAMQMITSGFRFSHFRRLVACYRQSEQQMTTSARADEAKAQKRLSEHRRFDVTWGVNPIIDRVVGLLISIRKRLMQIWG